MYAKQILLLWSLLSSYADSASYDQRQTGSLNVQVDLKDIHIIALMKGGKEEYVDYDYVYDYSEMTIKPQNASTTAKPLNVTATDAEIYNSTVATFVEQATEPKKNDSPSGTETSPSQSADMSSTTEKSGTTEVVTTVPTSAIPVNDKNDTIIPPSSNSSDCNKKGFVLNQKGDCELKLQNTGNALLKLVKLSQRLKLKRANRRNQNNGST